MSRFKRKALSMRRLYLLVTEYVMQEGKKSLAERKREMDTIVKFLDYVFKHKDEPL